MTLNKLIKWQKINSIYVLNQLDLSNTRYIWIENIVLSNLNLIPVNVTHLTIRDCNLLNISGIENFGNLIYVDVSNNPIYSIQELEGQQLEVLIISDTFVVDISVVSQLPHLKEFNGENSYIIDQQPLIEHDNFNISWISTQNDISVAILQILDREISVQEAQAKMDKLMKLKDKSDNRIEQVQSQQQLALSFRKQLIQLVDKQISVDNCVSQCRNRKQKKILIPPNLDDTTAYISYIIKVFRNSAKNNVLKVNNNQNIKSIQYADQILYNNAKLNFQSCYNLTFGKQISVITTLILNNCQLTTEKIQGLQHQQQLKDLNLGLNVLTDESLQIIGQLTNLKSLNISMNRFDNILAIRQLLSLKELDVSLNRIQTLSGLDQIQLEKLDASGNQIQEIKDFATQSQLKVLRLRNNKMKNITDISQMEQLVELDISGNNIRYVSELGALINLKSLQLQNNDIGNIDELNMLINLSYLNISNNKILFCKSLKDLNISELICDGNKFIDLEYIINMSKYQFSWVTNCVFKAITVHDFKEYLGDNHGTENSAIKLLNSYEQQIMKTNSLLDDIQKLNYFRNAINNGKLIIEDNDTITDLGFTDMLNITYLTLRNCKNVIFVKAPKKLTCLSMNNCGLCNVIGIENMPQLTCLNLDDNNILLIKQVTKLPNLTQFSAKNNYIQDSYVLKAFKNKKIDTQEQKNPIEQIYQKYLNSINSDLTITELIDQIYTDEYKQKLQKNQLLIHSDQKIMDLKFVDQLYATNVTVLNCQFVSFKRIASKITSLTLNGSDLFSVSGIEQMIQLTELNLNDNNILLIKPVAKLINLI
ncbi:Conserved_hypothetical protein [Hexamita inflata]|uniref:Uncharacterized protein n=1 Tax=Hexamita inflata TaxID=28002 RepID=A0AA86PIP2_9EUKA|nr:Conserved hypothetical protein [Hexamita inflata]